MRALRVIVNRFVMTLIIIVVASIPLIVFMGYDIKYGTHHDPLREKETFMSLAFTVSITTILIETGKLIPSRKINGFFGLLSLFVSGFFCLYVFTDYPETFIYFHALCSWGVLLYPILYILLRKVFREGFFALACPFIIFGGCMLIGLIPASIGNYFVAFKLPFILVLIALAITIFLIVKTGWNLLVTTYYEGIGRLPFLGGGNDRSKDKKPSKDKDKYDKEEEVKSAIWGVSNGYFDITDVEYDYDANEAWVHIKRIPGLAGEIAETAYRNEQERLRYQIEQAVIDKGYRRPRVIFK